MYKRQAYINHDIDDAIRGGILEEEDIPRKYREVLGFNTKERLNTMVHDIIAHSIGEPDIRMSEEVERDVYKRQPPEREIARMHTFSEEFKSKMEKLCRTNGKLKRQEMTRREFVFGFNRIAACILMMLAVGGICVGGYLISKGGAGGSGADSAASTEESTEQAADMALPERCV